MNQLTTLLEIAVRHAVGVVAHTETGLHAVEVDFHLRVVDAEFASEAFAVALGEQHGDLCDLAQQVEIRGETGDCAIEEHHVLYVEHEFLGHACSVPEHRLHHALHFLHQFFTRQRGGVDGGLIESEVLDDRIEIGVHRKRAQVPQGGHLSLHVVGGGTQHEPQERQSPIARESTHDAEVEERGASVAHHEQIAAVQVAMEHAVQQRALHERHHSRADDGFGVDTRTLHAGNVVELESLETFHHDDATSHQFGVWSRNHVTVLLEVGEDARDVQHVRGFESEVQLLDDGFGKQLDESRRVGECCDLDSSNEERCQPRHHLQVLANEHSNAWTLRLHHHGFTAAKDGCVHLGD